MIKLHHLGISQSERIVWILEELELPYELIKHTRAPALSPDSLKNIPGNETGRSPFLEDTDASITLGESGAIADYIVSKYGGGRLAIKPDDKRFSEYLYWFHYANGTLQPEMLTNMFLGAADLPSDVQIKQFATTRLDSILKHMDGRLKDNKWLAGDLFTAADCMSVYPLTTQRYWGPQISLKPYPNILRWLKDCADRPAFKKAMEKGDPEMHVLIDAETPEESLMTAGGVTSDIWKKK